MAKLFDSNDLGMEVNDISIMIDQYWEFLSHYNRDFSPLTFNDEYLTKAHFHEEVGRGGYFAPESGTSESQFLIMKGALECYEITNDIKWLNLAEELIQSTLKYLYKGNDIPDYVSEDNLWLPHWLYNASEDFVGDSYYLYDKFNFTNGICKLNSRFRIKKIYSVRDLDAKLEWENPYSKIIGKEYLIKDYVVDEYRANIILEEPFTGEAYVVFSDANGPIIEHNELYEAWPVWRKLKPGETACAVDSLWWIYDSLKILSKVTNKKLYKKALEITKLTIIEVMKVSNMNDWHVLDFRNNDCFSGSIGLYSWQNRYPEALFTRDKNTGAAIINIPKGQGQVQYGKGGINQIFKENNLIEVKLASNLTNKISLFIAPRAGALESERYTAYITLNGDNLEKKYFLDKNDFIKKNKLYWDLYYLENNSKEEIYTSDNSDVELLLKQSDKGREWREVKFTIGKELTSEGYEYDGWAQYQAIINRELFTYNEIPQFHLKLKNGAVNLRIKDVNEYYWEIPIQISDEFILYKPNIDDFIFSDYQTKDGVQNYPEFPIKELVFDAKMNSLMELKYIGEIETIPVGTNINDFVININNENEQILKLFYTRPLPLEGYKYTPYVAPFTVNTVNNILDTWRGTPYTGYQCPWIWQEIGDEKGVETVLDFMEEAQNIFYKNTNYNGFFMPVFIWDRWDSREYGEANTFSWNGPDPNTHWGGFQYRAIETVARTYFNDKSNLKAKRICLRFIKSVSEIWDKTGSYPTTFPENGKPISDYKEPHFIALFLRTLIFFYQNSDDKSEQFLCKTFIKKCVNEIKLLFHPFVDDMIWNESFINGTWSVENKEWYMFWGGEILSALSLLLKYCKNNFKVKTKYGLMEVETYPKIEKNIESYINIKTPIGVHKLKLIDINSSNASPIRVKLDKDIMAVGGIKMTEHMSKDVNLLIKNENNIMKKLDELSINNFLENNSGAINIDKIYGKTFVNISPRKLYNYKINGNWSNIFNVREYNELSFQFKIIKPFQTTMTMSFKDKDGNDFGWEDIGEMNTKKTIYHYKKIPENAVTMMFYLQEEGDVEIDDLLLIEGKFNNISAPLYFENKLNSCEIRDGKSLEVLIKKDKKIIDQKKLIDYIPKEYLPLRSNGNICDLLEGNILYKRIDSDGNILNEEKIIFLNDTFSLLECKENSEIEILAPLNSYPIIDLYYPVDFEKYVKEIIGNVYS